MISFAQHSIHQLLFRQSVEASTVDLVGTGQSAGEFTEFPHFCGDASISCEGDGMSSSDHVFLFAKTLHCYIFHDLPATQIYNINCRNGELNNNKQNNNTNITDNDDNNDNTHNNNQKKNKNKKKNKKFNKKCNK